MVEQEIMKAAVEETAKSATELALEAAVETATKEAVKITWKEGLMIFTSGVGTVAIVAGSIWIAIKIIKLVVKKIKAKKGISVVDAANEAAAEVGVETVKVEETIKVEPTEE